MWYVVGTEEEQDSSGRGRTGRLGLDKALGRGSAV